MRDFKTAKGFIAGVVITAMLIGVTPTAFAKVASVKLPVNYNNIKIVTDGKPVHTDKEPFIHNGTTYLPVRAVGEAVGKEVAWDGASNTVYLGKVPANKPGGQTQGYSRKNPAPIGVTQTYHVNDYSDNYTANIQIVDTMRGQEAWDRIIEANMFNEPPQAGKEYILVKARISVQNVKGDKSVSVDEYMFDGFSSANAEYTKVAVVDPEPVFEGDLYSGGSLEGYFVVQVNQNDPAPKVVFGRDYDGTGGIWFKITN